jgi:FixJ family two-component response regulator
MNSQKIICVIDDEEAIRLALSTLIRAVGMRVETFESAEAFLKFYEGHTCNCIIADIQMPGLSGIALKHRLDVMGCKTPVILITGQSEARLLNEAQQCGAMDVLRKPFDTRLLLTRIEQAFQHMNADG